MTLAAWQQEKLDIYRAAPSEGGLGSVKPARAETIQQTRESVNELFRNASKTLGVKAVQQSFKSLVGSLRPLALFNAVMVEMQRPGHTAVATRRRWKELHRTIRADARPILILFPHGPFDVLYEVTETVGPPVEEESLGELLAEGSPSRTDWRRLMERAKILGIEVEFTELYGHRLAGTASGMSEMPFVVSNGARIRWRIRLNARHDEPTAFATLCHELGHVLCGHLGADPKGYWPDRRNTRLEIREMEAESVAYLLCNRSDVTTRSDAYLYSLLHRCDCTQVDFYAIHNAVQMLEGTTLDEAIRKAAQGAKRAAARATA